MNLWKSLLIGFGTYVVLTFLGNLLVAGLTIGLAAYFAFDIWTIITTCFTGLDGLNPFSFEIYGGMLTAITIIPLGTTQAYLSAIGSILVPIVPGLTAAILAGKFGQTSLNGFFGMLITGIAITIYPIILLFVNPPAVLGLLPLINGSIYPVVVSAPWLQAIFTSVIGVLIGAFWGGLAAFFGRE